MTQAQLDALARGRRINVLNREVMPGLRKDHMTTVTKLFKKPNMHVGVFRLYKLPRTQGLGIPSTNRISKSIHQPLRTIGKNRKADIKHHSRMKNRVFSLPIPSARVYESQEVQRLIDRLPMLYATMLLAQAGTTRARKIRHEYYRVRDGVLFHDSMLQGRIERMEAANGQVTRL
jgi:hypothetical protein